ncbi:MAG: hypothetical protein AAGA71_03045 [Pseudomonadota bacterium]
MIYKVLAAGAVAAMVTAAPAMANTTMVSCPGYVVAMTDDVAIQGQVLAGSVGAFERVVCERSSNNEVSGAPESFPVFIEELGVTTRIVIFPIDEDNDD